MLMLQIIPIQLQGLWLSRRFLVDFCFHEFSQSLVSKHAIQMPAVSDTFSLFVRLISHQPAVLFSQNEPATSNQPQPANSTLLSEQTSTSHQPPANRTGCLSYMGHLHINIRALYDLIITPDNSILFSDTV
jgi:hypothetical protein